MARAALTDLAGALEDDRYAVARPTWQPGELQERIATVVREARRPTRIGSRRASW